MELQTLIGWACLSDLRSPSVAVPTPLLDGWRNAVALLSQGAMGSKQAGFAMLQASFGSFKKYQVNGWIWMDMDGRSFLGTVLYSGFRVEGKIQHAVGHGCFIVVLPRFFVRCPLLVS